MEASEMGTVIINIDQEGNSDKISSSFERECKEADELLKNDKRSKGVIIFDSKFLFAMKSKVLKKPYLEISENLHRLSEKEINADEVI